jgi:ABC-2 type transport system permease protein/oleandomycin transport system permease protein
MSVREVDQSVTSIEHHGLGRFSAGVADMMAIAERNLIAYVRVPQLLVFSTIQPIMFVLLFRYVFGGAVQGSLPPGVPYVEYLIPGVFVQTATFGALGSAIGLATDVKSGLLERFRSLPMARSAVLTGRTMADLGRNVFVTILMLIVGFLVGFRILTPAWEATCGVLLLLFFGYMLSWIFATVGLWTGDPETAQAAAFPILAPLVFASSAFVPVSSMPSWLQGFAEHQPVSVTASAVRGLLIGQIPGVDATSWYVIQSLIWCVGLIAVFAPLAVRRYRRAV